MKSRVIVAPLLLLGLIPGFALAQDEGKQVYQQHCSQCHDPGLNHPGTIQLTLTRGEGNGVLTERDNLAPAYVKVIVRQGLNAMPGFKPSIITGGQLDALADFLGN